LRGATGLFQHSPEIAATHFTHSGHPVQNLNLADRERISDRYAVDLKDIRRTVIAALFSDDVLFHHLVLKGGILPPI
jgi:hypothetical protein